MAQAIQQMVNFIKQEAKEKCEEIMIKAEEEFNQEKNRIVQDERARVKKEMERKFKQVEIQRRISFSNEVNASRLKVLTARDEVVTAVKTVVMNELFKLGEPSSSGYKDLCSKLVLQGLYQLNEPLVIIRCRKSDVSVVQGAMADAAKTFKAAMGKECKVELDKENLPAKDDAISPCAGGVKLFTPDFAISCDNTLDGRMDVVLAQKMPEIKIMLFGRSATRTHCDTDM
jgi:V-type H+-transporting ATPase subunit E